MARKVVAHLFNSINGVVESPHLWQFDRFGPEEGEMMDATIGGVTDVILGRKLWEEWSEYWPTSDDEFGQFINPVRKHVVSSTRSGELDWNSVAIDGDPIDYVKALRDNGSVGDITVAGGVETVRSLFLAGVIDTLTLTTHPAIGAGRRLFDKSVPITKLKLVDSAVTSMGNAVLTYSLDD